MSDLRKALKQAGVVSAKQVRQAQHDDRVRRKELGEEGLAAERRQKDEAHQAEEAQRKSADAEREKRQRSEREAAARLARLQELLRSHDLAPRGAGPVRFYFTLPDERIFFLDVSDALARRLAQGDAAIIDGQGVLDRDFGIIPGKVAVELERIARQRIVLWHARG